jgi:hypothetical protein
LTDKEVVIQGTTRRKLNEEPTGNPVLPGRYKVVFQYLSFKDSTYLNVKPDPRAVYNPEIMIARRALQDKLNQSIIKLARASEQIQEASNATEMLMAQLKDQRGKAYDDLKKSTKIIQDSLQKVKELIVGKKSEKQGYGSSSAVTPVSKMQEARTYIGGRTDALTATETRLVTQAEELTLEAITKINKFFSTDWLEYQRKVESTPIKIVKIYSDLSKASLE